MAGKPDIVKSGPTVWKRVPVSDDRGSSSGTQSTESRPFEVLQKDKKVHSPESEESSLRLSEHKKRLLAAKENGVSYPDFTKIKWYHPKLSRHVAESILLSRNTLDGTYLLRSSSTSDTVWTLSVRYKDSVKHYKVSWDGKCINFGLGKFKNCVDFLEHFHSQPVISGESGYFVTLKYPYPRVVNEPIDYEEPVFTEAEENIQTDHLSVVTDKRRLSINSKDGFLTKLGYHRKTWKLRWFKLFKNELSYYVSKDSPTPLRSIDLSEAISVEEDSTMGKQFCFRLETKGRTFYMYSQSELDMKEWIEVLRWKLQHKHQS